MQLSTDLIRQQLGGKTSGQNDHNTAYSLGRTALIVGDSAKQQ